jgi:hypothetical protein
MRSLDQIRFSLKTIDRDQECVHPARDPIREDYCRLKRAEEVAFAGLFVVIVQFAIAGSFD